MWWGGQRPRPRLTGEKPCDRLIADQAAMQPFVAPTSIPSARLARA